MNGSHQRSASAMGLAELRSPTQIRARADYLKIVRSGIYHSGLGSFSRGAKDNTRYHEFRMFAPSGLG